MLILKPWSKFKKFFINFWLKIQDKKKFIPITRIKNDQDHKMRKMIPSHFPDNENQDRRMGNPNFKTDSGNPEPLFGQNSTHPRISSFWQNWPFFFVFLRKSNFFFSISKISCDLEGWPLNLSADHARPTFFVWQKSPNLKPLYLGIVNLCSPSPLNRPI